MVGNGFEAIMPKRPNKSLLQQIGGVLATDLAG